MYSLLTSQVFSYLQNIYFYNIFHHYGVKYPFVLQSLIVLSFHRVYFTPDHTLGSHGGDKTPAHGEGGAISAVPKHVAQMFSLLQGSSEAQVIMHLSLSSFSCFVEDMKLFFRSVVLVTFFAILV